MIPLQNHFDFGDMNSTFMQNLMILSYFVVQFDGAPGDWISWILGEN